MAMTGMAIEDQVSLLMQGTEYGDGQVRKAMQAELRQRLEEAEQQGRPLRVYCGFDPRTSDLHLGHTVPIRKMRQFQELGHDVMFVIGRYTSLIGDPSDQDGLRAQISLEQATRNAETYADQAFKILDPARTRLEYNDEWLSRIPLQDWIRYSSLFTLQQFLTRETFRKRWDSGDPLYLHEFYYSILQAFDAYHLETDVQIGGTDQLFNILTAARKLMESLGRRPNIGIILGILPGTDGVVKMSKSLGNHIPLTATPEDMYGKVMSIPDSAMGAYFRLVTRWTPARIAEREAGLRSGAVHPRDGKMELAREIVAVYCGEGKVAPAEEHFRRVFQEHSAPERVPRVVVTTGQTLLDLVMSTGAAASRSEARRVIQQRGVRLDGEVSADPHLRMELHGTHTLQVGKKGFFELEFPGPT
jgi:tyrosyl-tRNA synthetase